MRVGRAAELAGLEDRLAGRQVDDETTTVVDVDRALLEPGSKWDPTSWQELLTLPAHAAGALVATFPPDGEHLAVAGEDGAIRVYVLDIGALIDLARNRVTRAMTDEECVRYLHIEQCGT